MSIKTGATTKEPNKYYYSTQDPHKGKTDKEMRDIMAKNVQAYKNAKETVNKAAKNRSSYEQDVNVSAKIPSHLKSYMKTKGITDVKEAAARYKKGEALVKRQQAAKAKADEEKRQQGIRESAQEAARRNSIGMQNLKKISTPALSSSPTSLIRPAQRTVVDAKTKRSMEKDINKTTRQADRAQRRYENTASNRIAAKQREKAQNLRASLATKKNAYSNIAKNGGKLSKKCKK